MLDALVFIGRFQPFHKGHEYVIRQAQKYAKEVIIVVGSSFAARSIRNPWTFAERKTMIKSVFPDSTVKVVPVADYPYNDTKWITAVQNVVYGALQYTPDPVKIGLVGHKKDETSYYLNIFPSWSHAANVDNFRGLNSTDIRNDYFELNTNWVNSVSHSTLEFLAGFNASTMFKNLKLEYDMVKAYKEQWKVSPFPPTFVTVDAVVVKSGHILLVERGDQPGKGLWALPGGFLNQKETLVEGAIRELKEETKLKVPPKVLLGSIKAEKTFDAPNRSTRGRTITTAFHFDLGFGELDKVKGSDDAKKAMWVELGDVVKNQAMFFEDHYGIIDYMVGL